MTSLLRRPPATGAVARRVAPGAIEARDLGALLQEMARAKERFGLPADAQVVSCYEAAGGASPVLGSPGRVRCERKHRVPSFVPVSIVHQLGIIDVEVGHGKRVP